MQGSNRILFAALVAIALLGAGLLGFALFRVLTTDPASGTFGEALVGGEFTLVDGDGRTVTDEDFRGKLMLVFFGFTYCPDVCPTELQNMSETLDLLGDRADAVQPIFITVDPERDTPEVIGAYVGHFHPRLVGLTGTPEQIAEAARAYRVYYRKNESGGATDYLMDHSSIVYLMGRDGKFLQHFSRGTSAAEMAAAIRKLL